MAKEKGLTPMMKQFFTLKAKHPDALMLFRCGDFYETYCEDAVAAAKILGITLTRRNNGGTSGTTEMAGFPHHALDTYLPKLIRAGRRVAICDQLEDPKLTKKVGEAWHHRTGDPWCGHERQCAQLQGEQFSGCRTFRKGSCGVAFLDISTGEFLTGEGTYDYVEKLIGNFQPKEVLYDRARKADFERYFGTKHCVFELDDWVFTEQTARAETAQAISRPKI